MSRSTCYRLPAALICALLCSGALAAMAAPSWRIDETHTSIGFTIDGITVTGITVTVHLINNSGYETPVITIAGPVR